MSLKEVNSQRQIREICLESWAYLKTKSINGAGTKRRKIKNPLKRNIQVRPRLDLMNLEDTQKHGLLEKTGIGK